MNIAGRFNMLEHQKAPVNGTGKVIVGFCGSADAFHLNSYNKRHIAGFYIDDIDAEHATLPAVISSYKSSMDYPGENPELPVSNYNSFLTVSYKRYDWYGYHKEVLGERFPFADYVL